MLNNNIIFNIRKFLIISIVLLLVVIIKGIDSYGDYTPSIIVQSNNLNNYFEKSVLVNKNISTEFKANYDNLETISIKFNGQDKFISDYLEFRIKEYGSDKWYYSVDYKVDQIQNNQYFSFSFPKIDNSKNKKYLFEVINLSKIPEKSISFTAKNVHFLSKYSFSKTYLLEHKNELIIFIFDKIKSFFNNVHIISYLLLLIIFCTYLLFLKFEVVKKFKKFLNKNNIIILIKKIFNNNKVGNRKIEVLLVILIYILIIIFLGRMLFYRNMQSQNGDTTFAAQIMMNIDKRFDFESSYARSILYSFNDVWYKSADYVCKSPLIAPNKLSTFGHFYFIAFPLGLLLHFFNIYWFVAFSHSVIYSSILLFVYIIARKFKLNIVNSVLLVLIAAQHPLWINGMYGQFYFNRFFLLFCSIVILLLNNKKINYYFIALFSLLAISTNEIYGVVLFMVFIAYLFLFKYDKIILFFSFFSLFISIILIYIIQQNAEPNLTQNKVVSSIFSGDLSAIIINISNNIFSYPSRIFLLVNFIFGGIFFLKRPKLMIIWLLFLLPNLVVYIGKLAWSTHYHISYFVPVLWLLVYAISLIKFKNNILLTLTLLGYLIIVSRFNIVNYRIGETNFIISRIYKDYKTILLNKDNAFTKFNQLQSSVGESDKISLPEALSYPFINHEIFYYPVNIDQVDKVVLFFDKNKIGDKRFYSINYGQQADNLDECILERMKKNGFDLKNPIIVSDLAIIGKK